jgi:nitroreductase
MLEDLVTLNRSYRRFYEDTPLGMDMLKWLVHLCRISPSAANQQALKFILSSDPVKNAIIYPCFRIDNNPPEGERPSDYIILLEDRDIRMAMPADYGIAAQTIHLGAVERGFGGCMIGAIDRDALRKALAIPERYTILMLCALGKPIELGQIIEDQVEGGPIRQWWDDDRVRHVPKRPVDELIVDFS